MADDPVLALDALLTRLGLALSGAGSSAASEGVDARGLVRVRVGTDGRLSALDLDPTLLRDRARIAPAVVEAVNNALDARPDPRADAAALRTELRAVQEASIGVGHDLNSSLLATLDTLRK